MKCPFCGDVNTSVTDSRISKDGHAIRRRRQCEALLCKKRFTTYERVESTLPLVVKKDGRREVFDRLKIIAGIKKACEKRSVSAETVEKTVDFIEHHIQELGEQEITSHAIGEIVMEEIKKIDPVAYVRFASVYRSFEDVGEFVNEIRDLSSLE